jgi:16S rRNA (adenine1518-N6/adenine1519-N6)-dimethyltransferase
MNPFTQFKKSLGQNFLIDQNIIKKIISIGNIKKKSIILEIGPGRGSLTKLIAENNPKKIFAIEKDKKLADYLKNIFKNNKIIQVINNDFLHFDENKALGKNVIVFGNLPYNISTKILAKLILLEKWPPWYESLIFMFQKEVADRIIAEKGSKNYGRLSILSNWRLEIKKHFNVSRNCFYPKPKINSTILSFKPKKNNQFKINKPKNLEKVTRVLFSNRRKMINKNFLKLFKNNKFVAKELGLNLSQRPEELNIEMFYKITLKYESLFN